jgi:hypothetical protein
MTLKRTLAAALLAAVFAVPAAADGKGGVSGGGGNPAPAPAPAPTPTPTPTPPAAACATLKSNNPIQEFTSTSHKAVTLSWEVANCSTVAQTLTTTIVPTAHRIEGACVGTPFTAGTVTLKPGAKQTLKVDAPNDACTVIGPTGLEVTYNAATRDASGTTLATAKSDLSVIFRGF